MGAVTQLLLIIVMISGLTGCGQRVEVAGELRVGVAQLPISLDPRFATDAASHKIQELLHRGLVRLDAKWLPAPDLAASWEHPTPLIWIFHLQPNVYFHNGEKLSALDVKATLDAILSNQLSSPLKAGFSAIDTIQVVDKQTLTIHLQHPDSSFLTRLSIGILPASIANLEQQAKTTVGCGAFQLKAWHGNDLILTRASPSHAGNIQTIHFIRVKDAVTRCLKLVRGEIDLTQNDLPAELLPYLQRQSNLQIQSQPSTTFSYLGLNLQDAKLKDLRVRQALALAIDRHRLKRALFSDLPILAETVLTPEHWAYHTLSQTTFNPQQAEILLDEAGFPRDSEGQRFHLVYRTSTDATRLRLATAIADMWQQIGIDVTVESLEWGGFYARIKRGDFEVFSLSWVSIADPDIYRWILHSDMWPPKGANRGRYRNAAVDQWLDQASASEDLNVRASLYANIESTMHDQVVYIPLWYEPVVAVSSKRLKSFVPASDGSFLGLLNAEIR